jgi:S-formylglutathione hydrolase FrmB
MLVIRPGAQGLRPLDRPSGGAGHHVMMKSTTKPSVTVLLVLGIACLLAVAAAGATRYAGRSDSARPAAIGRAIGREPDSMHVIHLKRKGQAYDVWVYRPRVRDSSRLPVVYFLHGWPGQPQDVFRYAHAAQVLDSYIAHGGTPVLLAAPDGNSPIHSDSEWGDASDGSDSLESFIVNAVIPAVEGSHRRNAAHRAIVGFSMGGYGAMNIALSHPRLFGQIVTLCGYFHLDDRSHMFATPASQQANDPDLNLEQARGHRILLMDSLGDGEPLTNNQSQDFQAGLSQLGIRSTLVMAPGTHSWAYVESQLPAVLRFLAGGWGHRPAT